MLYLSSDGLITLCCAFFHEFICVRNSGNTLVNDKGDFMSSKKFIIIFGTWGGFEVAGSGFKGCEMRDIRLRIAGCELRVTSCGIFDCGFQILDFGLKRIDWINIVHS